MLSMYVVTNLATKYQYTGPVIINGKVAKAGSEVKVGDVIQITFGIREISVKVLELRESSRKDTAEEMYQVLD